MVFIRREDWLGKGGTAPCRPVYTERFWAPDSSAVVYAGVGEDGRYGVWVQPVKEDVAAQLAADGLFATWPPK